MVTGRVVTTIEMDNIEECDKVMICETSQRLDEDERGLDGLLFLQLQSILRALEPRTVAFNRNLVDLVLDLEGADPILDLEPTPELRQATKDFFHATKCLQSVYSKEAKEKEIAIEQAV